MRQIHYSLLILFARVWAIEPVCSGELARFTQRLEKAEKGFDTTVSLQGKNIVDLLNVEISRAKKQGDGAWCDQLRQEKQTFQTNRKLPESIDLLPYHSWLRSAAYRVIREYDSAINRLALRDSSAGLKQIKQSKADFWKRIQDENPGVVFERRLWRHSIGRFEKKGHEWIEHTDHGRNSFEEMEVFADRIELYDERRECYIGLFNNRCLVKHNNKKPARTIFWGGWE